MAKNGGRWHPSITTHRQKMIRMREANKFSEKPKRPEMERIDLSRSNWSSHSKKK